MTEILNATQELRETTRKERTYTLSLCAYAVHFREELPILGPVRVNSRKLAKCKISMVWPRNAWVFFLFRRSVFLSSSAPFIRRRAAISVYLTVNKCHASALRARLPTLSRNPGSRLLLSIRAIENKSALTNYCRTLYRPSSLSDGVWSIFVATSLNSKSIIAVRIKWVAWLLLSVSVKVEHHTIFFVHHPP